MDTEITGTIVILYALIIVWVMGLSMRKRWDDLAGIGAFSFAATYTVMIGVVPAWSLASYLVPLSETLELLLLVGFVVLMFAYGFIKFPPTGAWVGLAVGLIGAFALKGLVEPLYSGWLARSPMPAWAVFWVGLIIVPIAYVFATCRCQYMVFGGLIIYAVILIIWLSLGASLPYLISCGFNSEPWMWTDNCPFRRFLPW